MPWRRAIVVGLVLVVLGIVLLLTPYRGRNRYPGNTPLVVAVDGCPHDESKPFRAGAGEVENCRRGAQIRLGLSAAGLVVGSALVLAGAIGVIRPRTDDT